MPQVVASTRHLIINSTHQPQRFCSNVISTCKYSPLTFFPRFLVEQFRRYNNIFFLAIVLLQQISDVSPTGRFTTLVPFVLILSISALKEIFEDIKRRASDNQVNNFPAKILRNGSFVDAKWKNLEVGQIIRVENDHLFPADLLLLSSSEQQGMAYIETSNLDGETNLKIKQSLDVTAELTSSELLTQWQAEIECEPPSRHVNEFAGNLLTSVQQQHFGIDQLLLRGARLKNTAWCFGAVIYTGHDAKLLMNSKMAPLKQSTVDVMTNRRIIFLFAVLVTLALISAMGAELWNVHNLDDSWYINFIGTSTFGWNALTFFILYNNLIPISLQVTLELVRFFQASYINNDLAMYDPVSDSCAVARTSNLNEELGHVKFVMSDKTGTLTQNIMKWKRCSVAGDSYGDHEADEFADQRLTEDYKQEPTSEKARLIRELLTMMACCHTVVPEKKEGELLYQGSSPDEGALVRGAASQGVIFHTRQPKKVVLNTFGADETIEMLDVIDFSSDRKRMSVVVRAADGQIKLYTKGADTVIFERLSSSSRPALAKCREHLEEYASFGYRTLCFAMADIDEETYGRWSIEYHKATLQIENRQKGIEAVAEEIERELELVGATAIEDKLQQFVPETIQALMAADMRVWMLTGDKRETAINIAHSCSLCTHNTELLIVDKNTYDETYAKLAHLAEKARHLEQQQREFAMVIDGKSLRHALTGESRAHFGDLAMRCRAVVCCRMSPMQKAEVVEMVRSLGDHVVMAVGDGANDVAMIQAANVGVGISGEEGLQAASASDYAIAQFHFLRRLLLVHGAWNYDRSVKVILYSFYKNICLYIIELWFAVFSAYSGQTIFERWTIGMFNVIFTAWPPVCLGLFDRPVAEHQMTRFPALYCSFQKRAFSVGQFCLWIGLAIVHSLLLFFFAYFIVGEDVVWSSGRAGGWLMLGNCAYTFVVATVCLKSLLECDSWSWPVVASSIGSILLWLLFIVIYSAIFPTVPFGADMAGMAGIMMSSWTFWLSLIFVPVTTLLPDLVIKSVFTITNPTPREMAVMFRKKDDGFERLASKPASASTEKTQLRSEQAAHDNLAYGATEMNEAGTSHGRQAKAAPATVSLRSNKVGDYKPSDISSAAWRNGSELAETEASNVTVITVGGENGFVEQPNPAFRRPPYTVHQSYSSTVLERVRSWRGTRREESGHEVGEPIPIDRLQRRSSSSMQLAQEARYGFAFSQEEEGPLAQTDLIRNVDSTLPKPPGR